MFGVLSIIVLSYRLPFGVILTSGFCVLSIALVSHLLLYGIIKYFMGLHMEIKENEMDTNDDPRMKIYFGKPI